MFSRQQSIVMVFLFALAGGILLTIFHARENLFEGIIVSAGVLFLLPCVYMLGAIIWNIIYLNQHERSNKNNKEIKAMRGIMLIPIIGGVGFGIMLVSNPDFFAHYIIYTFGAILVLAGIGQTCFIFTGIRYLDMSVWCITIPLLVICAGIGIFIIGADAKEPSAALFTGITLICYAVNGLISYIHRESRLRQQQLMRS